MKPFGVVSPNSFSRLAEVATPPDMTNDYDYACRGWLGKRFVRMLANDPDRPSVVGRIGDEISTI